MLEGIRNFPLSWPATWPRTADYKRQAARFRKAGGAKHSVAEASIYVLEELRRLGARNPIISSNMQYRQDGRPYARQMRLDDPGVAVYFVLNDQARVLACDRWTKVEDNLWAVGLHIEAIRGQARWGVGTIDQAFAGYAALPSPATNWWEVLGVARDADRETVQAAYRALAKQHHPDAGGSQEEFLRVQAAWESYQKEQVR